MAKRSDIHKIAIIGSGPIQIGQGCEFDYAGTQACLALRDEGYEVVLINSNPATIMTDPTTADRVYIEPLTREYLLSIFDKEQPDAILPTMGGQVALNAFMELHKHGDLEKRGIKTLGVTPETITVAEDRRQFKQLVESLGYGVVKGGLAANRKEAAALVNELRYPLIVRASFTLGGTGGGIAYQEDQLRRILDVGFGSSAHGELCIEESIIGWKEYELEVMRDSAGNFVVVCAIENINPVGVHTGDSITIAPCMTLTDREYQSLRDCAKDIFEHIGMETGGANIQFALHPDTGRMVVIEMNPRVSRSSALVSKATGYPIARIAAKLAVGLTLADIPNDITGTSRSAFEPSIDYVVVKIPRFDFEKFTAPLGLGASVLPTASCAQHLGIQMKSVGEVVAFGAQFKDAFHKAWRSLEQGYQGFCSRLDTSSLPSEALLAALQRPTPDVFFYIKEAFLRDYDLDDLYRITHVGRWFLREIQEMAHHERDLQSSGIPSPAALRTAKQRGLSNAHIAQLCGLDTLSVAQLLQEYGIRPTFKMIDTCAAESVAKTPYYYKTYEYKDDNVISEKPRVVILGSGPNRIGQGIEFDYSCVHAVKAVQEMGFYAVMINSNPETVSTDYMTADKLYMEPLTTEDVLDILEAEKPMGVLIQFGGQSALKMAQDVSKAGYRILGTPEEAIMLAEDREQFGRILAECGLTAPRFGIARTPAQASEVARDLGYPVLVRPSFVLGGRGMAIVHTQEQLLAQMSTAMGIDPTQPVLIDRYLEGAVECDVDAVCDGHTVYIPTILEHVEWAGIHSGDSACVTPCHTLSPAIQDRIHTICTQLALRLGVLGLLNVQFAIAHDQILVIEANPRSSRTVPFVSKATGIPLANWATKVSLGTSLAQLVESRKQDMGSQSNSHVQTKYYIKMPVFPFHKFPDFTPVLGPEMRSIGEVMASAYDLDEAFYKAWLSAGARFGKGSCVLFLKPDDQQTAYQGLVQELGVDITFLCYTPENRVAIDKKRQDGQIVCVVAPHHGDTGRHIPPALCHELLQQSLLSHLPLCFDTRSFHGLLRALRFFRKGEFA